MKEEWISFEWPGYHIYQAIAPMKAWMFDFAKFGYPVSKVVVAYSQGTTSFNLIKNEYEGFGKKFFKKIKKDPNRMFSVLDKVNEAAKKIFDLGKKWKKINFSKLSDKDLFKYHKEIFYWDEKLWRSGQIQNLLEFHNNYLTEYIREEIKKRFGVKNQNNYFQILSLSHYRTMQERQDKDFIKLFAKAKKKDLKNLKTDINRHWKKYQWMIYGWTGPALEQEYFINNLKEAIKNPRIFQKIEKKEKERVNQLKIQKNILSKFPEKKLAILLRKLLEAKAERVDAHCLTYFLADQIRGELAKRNFLSINQMRALAPEDTDKIMTIDKDFLNQASDFTLFWFEKDKGLKRFVGDKARKKFEHVLKRLPKVKMTNELKGEQAYPGEVKGRVKLILEASQFSKFQKGEILVTRITDPSYVPIMKMSKAIITDIGGITSHAAIVSRELKKPCVIGTKIATRVLKDGDMVEVDAERGVVRKI